MTIEQVNNKKTVLIVDDIRDNLIILNTILSENGYDVRSAINGQMVLDFVKNELPNIILLDIKMPQMDGFEVCRRLKADVKTKEIPIIFVSSLVEINDKMKAFQSGGVDYITKPFQADEVLARVKTHLSIQQLQQNLKNKNRLLDEEMRLREGVEHIIFHNLKGPLHALLNFPRFIERRGELNDRQREWLKRINHASTQMLDIVDSSLSLLQMEKGQYKLKPEPINIISLIQEVLNNAETNITQKNINIDLKVNGSSSTSVDQYWVLGEKLLCFSIFSNLIQNAIEASSDKEKVDILISQNKNETVEVTIHNNQPVPENIRDRFFDKYITTGKVKGTGLGTYTAKLSTEALGGSIRMETTIERGTSIVLNLPASVI